MEVDSGEMDLTFLSWSHLSIPTFSCFVAFPEHLLFLCMEKKGSQKSGEVVLLLVFPAPW